MLVYSSIQLVSRLILQELSIVEIIKNQYGDVFLLYPEKFIAGFTYRHVNVRRTPRERR